jgi:hypothetical protein
MRIGITSHWMVGLEAYQQTREGADDSSSRLRHLVPANFENGYWF